MEERCIFTAIDDFTSFRVAYPIQKKSDTLAAFKEFVNYVQRIFNYKVRSIRCNNGGEYCGYEFKKFCHDYGIYVHCICRSVYTSA